MGLTILYKRGKNMIKLKKLFAVLLVLSVVVVGFAACSGGEKEDEEVSAPEATPTTAPVEKEPDATPTPTPEPTQPPRDLGGIEIIVGDWWTTGEEKIETQKQEDQKAYRDQIQAEHNFKLTQKQLGVWAEFLEIFTTSTMGGNPAADIFMMDQKFLPEPLKQGLFYPVSDCPSFNNFENADLWNQSVSKAYSQNGKVYVFSEEMDSPGLGVFWNKRLFQEAGLDPDLIYDLQASGEWTWDKFLELARKLTRDDNNDGITDIYGVCGWQREIVKAGVFSNGSDYVRYNPDTGRYENNQKSDEVLASIKFAVDMFEEGLIAPKPLEEGSDEIKFFIDAFTTGKGAMCPAEWYRNSDFAAMTDDWGFAFFPKGPAKTGKYQTMYLSGGRVMSSAIDPQRADDAAFAYTLWISPVPGYEDDDPLTDYYSKARDTRAVEETIKRMIEGEGTHSLLYNVPGLSFQYGAYEQSGGLGNISPIEIADAASALFDAKIAEFYGEGEGAE
jgi:ABC-type glycerol-3-phosphate transport system substrate-binding protein